MFFLSLFFLLWPIKHKAGHIAYILIKLSYLVPCYYSLLLESGINCTQWSHRREKSLRINRFWDAFICWFHLRGGRLSPGKRRLRPRGRMSFWGPGATAGPSQPHPAGVSQGHPPRETCPVAVRDVPQSGHWGSLFSCPSHSHKGWSRGSLWCWWLLGQRQGTPGVLPEGHAQPGLRGHAAPREAVILGLELELAGQRLV